MNVFKIPSLLFFLHIWLLQIPVQSQERNPMDLQDFDGFTNTQYAAYLAADGWPVDELNTGRDADYLSDDEKNLILAMNLIRFDPPKYSKLYVYPRLQYFKGTAFNFPGRITLRTREGVEAVRELYLELLDTEPLPLFIPSPGMSKASKGHAKYMKSTGTTSHEGRGGMDARISKYGEWLGGLGENLQWATTNAHEAIMSLMIDDGIKNRGHRKNIMNPEYRIVGVGIDSHPRWLVSYVINYANGFIEK
jgi:hypothetical protein